MTAIIIIAALLLIVYAAAVLLLMDLGLSRKVHVKVRLGSGNLSGEKDPSWKKFRENMRVGREWFEAQNPERVYITSKDGIRLAGYYLPAEGARRTVLLVHGWRSKCLDDFSCVFRFYHENGVNILGIDQRGSFAGDSGGRFISYGIKERFDVQSWAEYAAQREPECSIFFDGVSMGAATVLMASALPMPKQVRGIIADCGYTSPWEEFEHVMKNNMRLPVWPLLHTASAMSGLFCGFGFKDCSAVEEVKKTKLPIFFAHGGADKFVPEWMSRRCYEACASEKELFVVPEAGHGLSFVLEREEYSRRILSFFDRCEKM